MKRFFPRPRLAGLLCALALPAWAAFTDNGNGTITDTTTGLVWDKCSRGQVWDNTTPPGTCTGAASTHTWAAALAQAVWHFTLIRTRTREGCFKAFRINHWLGATVFAGIAGSYLLRSLLTN